ncbi:MAG TPA: type IV toxin-antitoxin system AbiEi family antitoxin domain-containing protein [Solirubrobacterales bacterium]|nr:type IV toxin-antitoxin system AbiEi family antitoxin domain-containing protein [Solirubrobacterales bacterium]
MAELARRQHGVVSIAQLRAAGLGDGAIKWRAQRGRLHRIHRGVYAVGHLRLGPRGHLWAAVLAVPGGVLSHRSAAAVWDLCPPPSGRIDVTTTRASRSTKAIAVHHTAHLEATTNQGLPITTVARTLRDVAATDPRRLERLLERAEHLRLLDTPSLAAPSQPGARRLQRALDAITPGVPRITRSELEERFLEQIAAAGLPPPLVNAKIENHEVDFAWPHRRRIVETDGAATHVTATAFERDRRRDAHLETRGWRVTRFTWRQVTDGSAIQTLRRLL